MKPYIIIAGLLIVSVLLVFAAPHHRRLEGVSKPCTLGGVYADILSNITGTLKDGISASSSVRGAFWFILLTTTALVAASFPAVFVGLAKWWPATNGRGAVYVIAGLLVVIGAAANFLAMLVSHMSFGFGVSNSSESATAFIWIIPLFQTLFGVASVAAGSSSRFAGWLNQLLG